MPTHPAGDRLGLVELGQIRLDQIDELAARLEPEGRATVGDMNIDHHRVVALLRGLVFWDRMRRASASFSSGEPEKSPSRNVIDPLGMLISAQRLELEEMNRSSGCSSIS